LPGSKFLVYGFGVNNGDKARSNLSLLAALAALLAGASPLKAAQEENVVPQGVIQLFNGRDLSGLYSWLVDTKRDDPRQVFTVTNRMIRISGDGLGYLGTERAYENYRLLVEFKWGDRNWEWGDRIGKARDSGIFLHGTGPDGNSYDGNGAFMAAIECNVFQGATGDFLLIRGTNAHGGIIAPRITAETGSERDAEGWPFWQRGGRPQTIETWGRLNWFAKDRQWRDQTDFRGPRDVEEPYGQWNRIECICSGNRITTILNGVVVNEATTAAPQRGKILLQSEGSEIFFRRFELHPLQ
jgi:hypothetical protein